MARGRSKRALNPPFESSSFNPTILAGRMLHVSGRAIHCVIYPTLFVVFAILIFAAFGSDRSIDAWPMFRGSPDLSGVTATDLPKPLKLGWSFEANDSIESSAAIVNGVVYVGSMDASLYALDLDTGKLRWRYATDGPVEESSPCVYKGIVYIGDLNGILHAVDASSGKARWTFEAEMEIRSSPNCINNRVYFGSYDENLYCLSADKGVLLWKYTTKGPLHSTPASDGKYVYVSGCDETFRAIDAASGSQIYALPLGAYSGASAALRDNHAYIGTFGNEVLCINLRQQANQWVYRHPTRSFPFYSSAAVTEERVVVGGRDKIVHCLERATGRQIWTFTTRSRVESSPLIAGNRVFIGSNDGHLYELDLVSGEKTWDFTAGAPLSASPAAAQNSLVIGSQDGVLYCCGK
jgi:outer membrane protein assembly factor BamB